MAVLVNNRPCRALIDTASSHNFVCVDVVDIRSMQSVKQEVQLALRPQTVRIAREITVTIDIRGITTMTNTFVSRYLREESSNLQPELTTPLHRTTIAERLILLKTDKPVFESHIRGKLPVGRSTRCYGRE
ncbi:hypothetical protein PR048_005910 [Dryococelus australis]|uniref:Uncharacterized protein n=1 Tax=Dryococelus australis TaxID=614101 RepID=A0ABQ9IAK4_9NEOP|nr:hypothetical protein PR048_005910 [Dryococelus australis]